MLKKTYSPELTIWSSSAASMISRIFLGAAHRTMTMEGNNKRRTGIVS